STMLDNSLYQVSRQIRTGQMTMENSSRNVFRNAVCERMYFLESDCQAKLRVDVRPAASFGAVSLVNPLKPGGDIIDDNQTQFDTGGSGSVVVVQAFYHWKLVAPTINQGLERQPGTGYAVVSAVTAFRNEPW